VAVKETVALMVEPVLTTVGVTLLSV